MQPMLNRRSGVSAGSAAFLTAAFLAVLALAGCGGSSSASNGVAAKSPEEVLSATRAAVAQATSVHMSGTVRQEGSPASVNLHLVAGKGARGEISERNLSFSLIEVDNVVYISGSPAFYSHFGGSAAAALFRGKWLEAPANSAEFQSLSSLTNLRAIFDQLLGSHGVLKKAGTSTVAGEKAVALDDTTQGGTLYVAATGKPYPLEITKSGKESGTITFNDWNAPVTLKVPANAIDISQLRAHG